MVCSKAEGNWPEDFLSPEEETLMIARQFGPQRKWDPDGPKADFLRRSWARIQGPEIGNPGEFLAGVVRQNFYLDNPILGKRVSEEYLWVQHTGVGKHTTDSEARRWYREKTGNVLPEPIGEEDEMVEFLIRVKRSLRGTLEQPPLDLMFAFMSLSHEMKIIDQVQKTAKENGVFVTWRSHLALFEDMVVGMWGREIDDFMSEHRHLWHEVWGMPMEELVVKRSRELEKFWEWMAKKIHDDMNGGRRETVFWPFIELTSPITGVQDIDVPTTWALQEIADEKRKDQRPGGNHPFTVEQLVQMRLVAATMVYKFPKQFYVFGGYRSDYQNNGGVEVAMDMWRGAVKLYRESGQELRGDSRVIADCLGDK